MKLTAEVRFPRGFYKRAKTLRQRVQSPLSSFGFGENLPLLQEGQDSEGVQHEIDGISLKPFLGPVKVLHDRVYII